MYTILLTERFSARYRSVHLSFDFARMLSTPDIAFMIAGITMCRAFAVNRDGSPDEANLSHLEMVARFLHAVLEHLGTSPHLQSLTHIWDMTSRALIMMEQECFPGEPTETPNHIALPSTPRPISALAEDSWHYGRQHVLAGWRSLLQLRDFIHFRYDRDMHLDVFRTFEDGILLVETVAFVVSIRLQPAENVEEY